MSNAVLIDIQNVTKLFPLNKGLFGKGGGAVKALAGLDLQIREGETLGLVGESGCGKTTLGRLIALLDRPTTGRILYRGNDILSYRGSKLKAFRREVQVIFQDPYSSLNPRMSAGAIVAEPLVIHGAGTEERERRLLELFEAVGLRQEHLNRYPHEFSGGQRQRIGIARALALNPRLIVADEPLSALDVSIQAQILNLLRDLQSNFSLTYLLVSHDLSVVGHLSDRIAVMYLGKIMETAGKNDLREHPYHPYTEALLSAVPASHPRLKRRKISLTGDMPNPLNPPEGCFFHPRCPCRMEICTTLAPPLEHKRRSTFAACHLDR